MSEILFEVSENEVFDKKYKKISNSIEKIGFSNTALKFSISETATLGGKLNWINENSLNKSIRTTLNARKINEITDPITVPGGFLILKIKKIKIQKIKRDIEAELKKLINSNRNSQLNQFSKMYFNKIKENIKINEN